MPLPFPSQVVENRHFAPLLQFVGGLGPRKSQALIRGVTAMGDKVVSRKQLLDHKLLGPKVFPFK